MIVGYNFFFSDPHFNLAKALIVACGTINTMIIQSQIYIIYGEGEPEVNEKNKIVDYEDIKSPNALEKLQVPLLSKD